jgi:hypothetical protein
VSVQFLQVSPFANFSVLIRSKEIYYGRMDPGAETPDHSNYPCPLETIHWLAREIPNWFAHHWAMIDDWETANAILSAYPVSRLIEVANRRIGAISLPQPDTPCPQLNMKPSHQLGATDEEEGDANRAPGGASLTEEMGACEMRRLIPRVTAGRLHATPARGGRFGHAITTLRGVVTSFRSGLRSASGLDSRD